jgi:hypothetical protein
LTNSNRIVRRALVYSTGAFAIGAPVGLIWALGATAMSLGPDMFSPDPSLALGSFFNRILAGLLVLTIGAGVIIGVAAAWGFLELLFVTGRGVLRAVGFAIDEDRNR